MLFNELKFSQSIINPPINLMMDSQNNLFTNKELYQAALLIFRRTNRIKHIPTEQNSRITDKAVILIGREGEIIGRVKLSEVLEYCERRHSNPKSLSARVFFSSGQILHKAKDSFFRLSPSSLKISSLVISLLFVGFSFSYCTSIDKSKRAEAAKNRLDKLVSEWDIDRKIANNTSRIALAAPVMKLRDQAVALDQLILPECFETASILLRKYMDTSIEALTEFMGDSDANVAIYFLEAEKYKNDYQAALDKCTKK